MAHPQPSLPGLPPELQHAIAERFARPSDLKNLCLACKSLNTAALPLLYYKVNLNLDDLVFPTLNGFFLARNPGHKYTRKLSLEQEWSNHSDEMARTIIKLAISMVPEDTLESLRLVPKRLHVVMTVANLNRSLPSSLRLDAAFFLDLARRQTHLTELDCGPFSDAMSQTLLAPLCPADWLSTLTTLKIPRNIADTQDLEGFQDVLKQAQNITSMTIRSYYFSHSQYTASGPVAFVETLFRHIMPFGELPPLNLTDLCLQGLGLEFADNSYLRISDFAMLRDLTVTRCYGTTKFLQLLMKTVEGRSLRLKTFVCQSRDPPDHVALSKLVRQSPDLCSFHFAAPGSKSEADKIQDLVLQEGRNLESLTLAVYQEVDDYSFISAVPPPTAMEKIATRLSKLRDVALGSPHVPANLSSVGLPKDYTEYLCHVSSAAELRALRIMNWPTPPDTLFEHSLEHSHVATVIGCSLCELTVSRYQALLKNFAVLTMRTVHDHRASLGLPALRALSFGGPYESSFAAISASSIAVEPERTIYMPQWERGYGGEPPRLGVACVTWNELAYIDEQYGSLEDFYS